MFSIWWFLPLFVFPLIDQGYFSLTFVGFAIALSLVVGWFGSGRNRIPYPRTLFILWMSFLGVGVIATGRALSPPWSVLGLAYVVSAFLASVAGAMVGSRKARNGVMIGIIGSSVILSLLTIADVLSVIPTGVLPAFVLYRVNSGHAPSAIYLLFALPILLVYRSRSQKGRWVHIFAAAIIGTAFLLSFARGAFIGALVQLVYLGVVGSPDIRKIARVGVLGMVLWLLLLSQPTIIASLFPELSVSRFFASGQSLARLVYKPVTQESRGEYWRIAGEAIRERPLIGWGFGAYRFLMTRFRNSVDLYSDSAHNFYLETAVETGLIGGVLFAILLVWSLFLSFRSPAISAGLVGSAVSAFFGYEWVFPSVFLLFWFLVGLTARRILPVIPARLAVKRAKAGIYRDSFNTLVVSLCVFISLWGVFSIGGILPYLHPRVADAALTTIVTYSFSEMEPALRKLGPLFRADRNAQLMLSSWYERQDQRTDAIAASDAAYRADPLNLVTVRWFRQLLLQDGQVERAHALEDEVLARLRTDTGDAFGLKDQGNRSILLEMAREDCNTGDCRRGREIYRMLLTRYPDARAEVVNAILRFLSELDKNRRQEMAAEIFDNLPPSSPQK